MVAGAGVSAESGLGTFRDKNGSGIWARFDPMKLATPEAFARDPLEVHAFCNARRRNLITASGQWRRKDEIFGRRWGRPTSAGMNPQSEGRFGGLRPNP